MVLGRKSILEKISREEIRIDPFRPENLGPASLDLTLAPKFRRPIRSERPIDIVEDIHFDDWSFEEDGSLGILLQPGELVLGMTVESIALGPGLCGRLEGRSRFARMGLTVHVTAGFMQPGIANRQVLEIANLSPNTLRLLPSVKFCQFIFETFDGTESYSGRYAKQSW